ncbi:hypothetical protein SISSUDRAFT_1047269 [Sistotremastrum suecicum HHB10207 ss-3]|uniref:Uncharacterized protein n=1 Tax=Sistotremastrum suecicum HHB10207 ss-3 TaxID=1314776 RepID=A0A166DAC4_9AGAM|nr:hypothetical protein SISSUDRAFT_1047269 [Sistotremastrum suecicum HHB10207 ss-3]
MALSDLPKMILRLPLPNIRLAPSPYQVHWPTPPTSFEEAIELARTCPRKPIRNSEPSVSPTAVQLETHDIDAGVSTKNQIYNALYSGPLADMQSSGEDYAQDIRRCSAESLAGPEIPEAASPSPNLGSSARQASASPRNERYHPYPAPNSIEAEQSVARSPRVKTKSESSRAANFKDGDRDVPQNPKYASIHPQLNRSDGESARDAGVPQSLKLVGQLDPLGARWTPEALAVADEVHLNIGSRPFVVLEPYLRRCRVLALRLFPSRLGGLGVCINESQVLFVKHLFDSQDLLKCHPSNVALLLLILAHGHSTFGDSQSLLYQYTFKEYKGKAEALKDYLIKGAETLLNVTDWSRNDMTAMQAVVLLGLHHFNDKDAWSGFQPRLKRAIDACRSRMESRGMSYRDPLSDTSEFTARSKAQEVSLAISLPHDHLLSR